jgi:hypothetical protein
MLLDLVDGAWNEMPTRIANGPNAKLTRQFLQGLKNEPLALDKEFLEILSHFDPSHG